MPRRRLCTDELDCIMAAKRLELTNVEIARKLGVSEGAIRYRLKRQVLDKRDGRKAKPSQLDRYDAVIGFWCDEHDRDDKRPVLKVLLGMLRRFHGYLGSYDALRRHVTRQYPDLFKRGKYIRLETPPGQLLQVDWKEDIKVQLGEWGNWRKVNALVLTLAFSRKTVVLFTERRDLDSFIRLHQEAFKLLEGLPAMLRMDCLKSAVLRWQGLNSVVNERYRRFLSSLGLVAFPARPGRAEDKGKVEKRILDMFSRLDLKHRLFTGLADLQSFADEQMKELETEWRCGATGLSVKESFEYERDHLRKLPEHFVVFPLAEARRRVRNDGMVSFAGNFYQVHHAYTGKEVLCQHNGREIVIYQGGEELERYEYLPRAKGMVRLSPAVLTDPGLNLSDIVRRWGLEVAGRQVEIYQEIIQRRQVDAG